MMKLSEIFCIIEETAPLAAAAAWDKSGLQVAALRENAEHVAVCIDPTPDAVSKALDAGADAIVTHHPLTLKPRYTDTLDNYHQVLRLLFNADVPLYAAHTSLDANALGPVGWYARHIGLQNICVLEPTATFLNPQGQTQIYGFGQVGDLIEPVSLEDLLSPLPKIGASRLAGRCPSRIKRVAVCPGSGASLAQCAAQFGAELLITGDVKYHDALDAPLPLLDLGHFALEEEMMRLFSVHLQECLSNVQITFIPAQDPLCANFLQPLSAGETR